MLWNCGIVDMASAHMSTFEHIYALVHTLTYTHACIHQLLRINAYLNAQLFNTYINTHASIYAHTQQRNAVSRAAQASSSLPRSESELMVLSKARLRALNLRGRLLGVT